MAIEELPIFCHYDKQRFEQFGSMDCANWYNIAVQTGKKQQALYPTMGRKHIEFFNQNRLIFDSEPRYIFKTIDFLYVVDGTRVFQVDKFYNQKLIGHVAISGSLWFDYLPVGTVNASSTGALTIYALLTDEQNIYIISESGTSVTMEKVTDPNAPKNPLYVAAFGNRFVVSSKNTPDYSLSRVNLLAEIGSTPANCFTINGVGLFNRASGVIGQFGVLHNQLYIFCDFSTDVWALIPSQFTVAGQTRVFPWKLNTSYNWDYGIADPYSLSIEFGRMVWLSNNYSGLVSFMVSDGGQPQDISSQAVNTLLQQGADEDTLSPFLEETANGFIYQYENTVFYRVSAGRFTNLSNLQINESANCIEYNFETGTWHRVIELNGDRNRIQQHVYFNNKHLVSVIGDPALYQMAGNIYHNELRNIDAGPQDPDAFKKYPMRYELVTQQLYLPDYSEFMESYVEIDFVFGNQTFYKSNAPFLSSVYLVSEESTPENPIYVNDEDGKFVIQDGTGDPTFDDSHYNALFKPHIELYFSDDGGVTFESADLREFSQLGQYRWRMRWYELFVSRNRCYRLVCVSSAPIVVLGAVRDTRRVSGGAN